GVGVVTALGLGWKKNAAGFRSGQTAFRSVSLFDVSRQRVQTAAEISLPAALPETQLAPRHAARLDRAARMLLHAAHEAWTQAGWRAAKNLPVVLGTTSGGMALGEAYFRQAITPPHSPRRQAGRLMHYLAQRQGVDLADAFEFHGSVQIIANACASGANAVGHAFEMIRSGRADRVFTGGYDAISQLVFAGFDSLQALSPTTCRPFAADRDGLALGEGAAVFALENLASAQQRGAEILGEIVGYGSATDAHHLTQPQPQGDAAFASMTAACASANLAPAQISYVNAHGTGTPLNDAAEAAAINRWAGAHARQLRVSSTKASIGHLLGAAGAVEIAVCLMALRGQWLPPQLGVGVVDAACQFSLVRAPENAALEFALTNSFGFGGANASVILRRWV
ncbi:MAG: hypothetical protein RLZZ350_2651, partial [Verrucomicrobiota bacterium]